MRSVLAWFTVRGASFLTAGIVGLLAALVLGSDAMISVGALLICLPLFSAVTARRARYQLRCARSIVPIRVSPGQPAKVAVRLENVSRISTGLLLAEETIPYSLGARPRYVINGIERSGAREVTYQLRSDVRGKFQIGPMRIRIADVFGLVELTANFASQNTLTVTPKVVPLTSESVNGSWSSDGDGRTRMTAAAGDDDVIPRAYRNGDELRRVHWRSTARYGELMVRREEQRWQDRAVLILDTRRTAHTGSGPSPRSSSLSAPWHRSAFTWPGPDSTVICSPTPARWPARPCSRMCCSTRCPWSVSRATMTSPGPLRR